MPSPFQPIPGTQSSPRGLFVDHWGTLLCTPSAGFAQHPDEVEFSAGALEALFQAKRQGWNIYLIGNEASVTSGQLDFTRWQEVEDHVVNTMHRHGVPIQRNYICIDDPEGRKPHNKDSVYMLPNTGAMYHATQEDGIVLSASWVIGDGPLELAAGWRAGCRTVGVNMSGVAGEGGLQVEPEVLADDLAHGLSQVASGVAISR